MPRATQVRVVLMTVVICLPLATRAEVPEPCGSGNTPSNRSLRVTGSDITMMAGPSKSSAKLINRKASEALKTTYYLAIGKSVTVIEDCTKGSWSRVRVSEPEWLRDTHIGWVPSNALRGKKLDSSGTEIFTEEDISWTKKTVPYKAIIVAGVNKMYRENERCKDIDLSSVFMSSSKGTKENPVFFVTCGKDADVFNAYFSKSDVANGVTLAAAQHLDQAKAIELCEGYAKSKATHPSTVDFSRFVDLGVTEFPNGRTRVSSTFTAKNSFNVKLKHNINCLLDNKGLIEGNIAEAR